MSDIWHLTDNEKTEGIRTWSVTLAQTPRLKLPGDNNDNNNKSKTGESQ